MIQQFHCWLYTQKNESRDMKRYLYNHVHNRIIYNSQKVEATQVSLDASIDKQNVVYTYSGGVFSLKNILIQHGWILKKLC